MKLAEPTDLASDLARLTLALADAEHAAVNPQAAKIAAIRSELAEKQRELTTIEESQANAARRQRAEATLRNAEQAIEFAKDELPNFARNILACPL